MVEATPDLAELIERVTSLRSRRKIFNACYDEDYSPEANEEAKRIKAATDAAMLQLAEAMVEQGPDLLKARDDLIDLTHRTREACRVINIQADALEGYAEQNGYSGKAPASVFHWQATHFRDHAADLLRHLPKEQ